MTRGNVRESFDRIFRRATRTRLVRQIEDMCQIGIAAEGDSVNGEEALILTISSIALRPLLVLRFDESDTTYTYFTGEGTERSFKEAHLEIGNLCCGALNQELLQVFSDLGMSMPYMVSTRCLPYLDAFKPGYVATYAVTINGMVRVDATVRVCAHAPLDFAADMSGEVESGGGLESFRFGSLRTRKVS